MQIQEKMPLQQMFEERPIGGGYNNMGQGGGGANIMGDNMDMLLN